MKPTEIATVFRALAAGLNAAAEYLEKGAQLEAEAAAPEQAPSPKPAVKAPEPPPVKAASKPEPADDKTPRIVAKLRELPADAASDAEARDLLEDLLSIFPPQTRAAGLKALASKQGLQISYPLPETGPFRQMYAGLRRALEEKYGR
jgi:hypothetical protein